MSSIVASLAPAPKLPEQRSIDRWSLFFLLLIASLLVFLFSDKYRMYAGVAGAITMLFGAYLAKQPGRIQYNDYKGTVLYKGENDCGFSSKPINEIDGVAVREFYANNMMAGYKNRIYKTANGTDIFIDGSGNVQPCGFGSRLINRLDNAGYLNGVTPDKCWVIN